jgi:outer membrane protein assembly factor BamA
LPDSTTSVKSTTVKTNLQLTYFIPLTKRQVLKVGTGFETYFAPQVYTNELYRFGGLNTLRGFNEEELFASTKLVGSFEYRFLTDKNSYAFAFFDQGFYENVAGNYKNDHPFGFGAGFSFGTQLGIFSISYAQGKQFDNPILLRNGKVHFGYIAYF